ncbi:MAG TPA: MMPL family transporter [Marmoricola sp.]|nr:MMPL family transporter [Marmoricola sp.]
MAIFQVIPDAGPTDPTTQRLVKHLRQETVTDLEPLEVTGQSALNIDLTEVLAAAIPTYLVVIVGLSLLVLLLVFRSVFLPIAATSGFLLTIVGTMGLMSLVFSDARFTWVVGLDRPGPILSFLPIMASGILYGLAMDYQVFLGTSMREAHVRGVGARQAVVDGFSHSSRVVFAAAVIMVSVFGGFVLTDDTMIRQFGFALSVGILIDAFLIRMTLMPALLLVVGEVAWWLPRWLDELLPKLDLEGTQLRQDE